MPTTVTRATASGVSTHHISFTGLAGGIFWCLLLTFIIYVLSFATTGWQIRTALGITHKLGLWDSCECDGSTYNTDWFKASQAMFCIALILMVVAMVLAIVYMFLHKANKNLVILLLAVCCFVAALFMLIGLSVFGSFISNDHGGGLNYSFAFACIAGFGCLLAGVLALVQMIQSGRS